MLQENGSGAARWEEGVPEVSERSDKESESEVWQKPIVLDQGGQSCRMATG